MSFQIKLPYLGSNTLGTQSESPFGYTEIKGLELYNNASLRNVRVVRVDLLKYLTEHFSEETIQKYRNVLYYIFAGYGKEDNKDLIIQSLEEFYKTDDVFKIKLGKIFYFRDDQFEGLSVYDALMLDVKQSLDTIRKDVVSKVPYVKVICDSHLYVYFSVGQLLSMNNLLQIKGLEVISR